MKAYGVRHKDELEYPEHGAPSRKRKITGRLRRVARRALHKQGRKDGKKELKAAIRDV